LGLGVADALAVPAVRELVPDARPGAPVPGLRLRGDAELTRREAGRRWAEITEAAALARVGSADDSVFRGDLAGGTSLFRFAQALKAWDWTPAQPTGEQVTAYLGEIYTRMHPESDPDAVFETLDLHGLSYDPLIEFVANFDAVRVPGGAQCLARAAAHGLAHPVSVVGGLRSRGYRQFLSFVLELQRKLPGASLGLGVARVAALLGLT
jgi:hypothetical protein